MDRTIESRQMTLFDLVGPLEPTAPQPTGPLCVPPPSLSPQPAVATNQIGHGSLTGSVEPDFVQTLRRATRGSAWDISQEVRLLSQIHGRDGGGARLYDEAEKAITRDWGFIPANGHAMHDIAVAAVYLVDRSLAGAAPAGAGAPDGDMTLASVDADSVRYRVRHDAVVAATAHAGGAELVTERGVRVLITPSAHVSGRWQATRMAEDGPLGHSEHASLAEAVGSYRGVSTDGSLPHASDSTVVRFLPVDAFASTARTDLPCLPVAEDAHRPASLVPSCGPSAATTEAQPSVHPAAPPIAQVDPCVAPVSCGSTTETKAFIARLRSGDMTATTLQAGYAHFTVCLPQIRAELMSRTLDQLAPNRRSGLTKPQVVESIINNYRKAFIPGGAFTWSPFSEKIEDAVLRQVHAVTDADIAAAANERQEKRAATSKAMTNPETLDEYRVYLFHHDQSTSGLSDAQLARYDDLVVAETLSQRVRAATAQSASQAAAGTGRGCNSGVQHRPWRPHEASDADLDGAHGQSGRGIGLRQATRGGQGPRRPLEFLGAAPAARLHLHE